MGFLTGFVGGMAGAYNDERDAEKLDARKRHLAEYESQLQQNRMVMQETLREKFEQAKAKAKRDQDVTDAKTVQEGAKQIDTDRSIGLINATVGSVPTPAVNEIDGTTNEFAGKKMTAADIATIRNNMSPEDAKKFYGIGPLNRVQQAEDSGVAARNAGLLGMSKEFRAEAGEYRQQNLEDKRDALGNRREDNAEKFRTKQLELQIANHKEVMARMGGDSATKKLAQLKLDAMTEENDWRKGMAKLPAGDPKRAAEMQRGMDMGWVKAEPNDVSTTVKTTSGAMTDAPVETTVTTKGRAVKDVPQSESQAQADAQRFIAAGKISLADANKRLESAGFKPLVSDATKPAPTRSLQELKRIAAKPKGTSTAEANSAQAEIDYLRNNPDRIGAF